MIIQFSTEELNYCEKIAKGRHELKDRVNPNRPFEKWNNTQHEADLIGVIGEYAVGKYLNVEIDENSYIGGDGGVFDLICNGITIQVKSTKSYNGRLLWKSKDKIQADQFIFVIVDLKKNIAIIKGFISKYEALEKCYSFKFLGYGNRFAIEQTDLNDILDFKNICATI